jgi:predicted TPR repeat methyltransferase
MLHPISRFAPLLLLSLLLAGCATTVAVRAGQRAELAQDYDRAVIEYTRALQANPDNRDARQGLDRSRAAITPRAASRKRSSRCRPPSS